MFGPRLATERQTCGMSTNPPIAAPVRAMTPIAIHASRRPSVRRFAAVPGCGPASVIVPPTGIVSLRVPTSPPRRRPAPEPRSPYPPPGRPATAVQRSASGRVKALFLSARISCLASSMPSRTSLTTPRSALRIFSGIDRADRISGFTRGMKA